ncbi:MAG TPA: ferredoxin [Frankiaceae bacterium]|nr:ferredoxin [Frankiaceae bacterium]
MAFSDPGLRARDAGTRSGVSGQHLRAGASALAVGAIVIVRVDHDRCAGHARCHAMSAELFPIDDDGYVSIDQVEVPAALEDDARRGAAACPERAITVAP